jgi:Ca2+-binding RTX toxin-like protein
VDYDLDNETLTITAINGSAVVFDANNKAMVPVADGELEIHRDGSFIYTHNGDQPAPVSFTYTITDGNGASSTSTANVTMTVTPVADAPELIVSVIKGEEQPGIVYPAPAFNNHLNAGTTTGNIVFAGYTKTAAIDIKSYKTDVDDGRIVFLRDGVVIKEVLIDSILPNANNAPTHLVLNTDEYFNTIRVENYATSADSNAEFKVDSVSFITNLTFNYTLNIAAELTDSSETLGPVMIGQAQLSLLGATLYANGVLVSDVNSDGYLSVALSDAVAIKTDHNLTVDEINSITSSITSTTADGSDSATTTTTALLDIAGTSGDDVIPGSIGDDMIHGEDGTDTLIGGLGNDILTGGDGADIFKWTADDINIASGAPFSDTITDFSITEGDKLDLSDVLTGDTTTLSNYLDVQASGSNVVVSVYADGVSGGTADMTIVLEGQSADLTALQTYLLTQNGVIH